MKTPLTYPGGKQRLAKKIVELMPLHSTYVEPFAGGLAVLFEKGIPKHLSLYNEVINDLDGEIVAFWRAVQSCSPDILRIIFTPYSVEEHKLACFGESSPWATFISRVQGFAHQPRKGWARSKPIGERPVSSLRARALMKKKYLIVEAIDRLQKVSLECKDASEVIKTWDSPQTLIYCDPPYPETEQSYANAFTLQDLQSLVNQLDASSSSIMLSCYDIEGLEVPSKWTRHTFEAACAYDSKTALGDKEKNYRTEVLYVFDASDSIKEEKNRKALWTPIPKDKTGRLF